MRRLIICVFIFLLTISVSTSYAGTIINPSFEDTDPILSGWLSHGIVSQVTSGTVSFDGYSYDITAPDGDYMALLSAPGLSGGGLFTDNWIEQTINDFEGGTLSFYYNMYSTDWYGEDRFVVDFRIDIDAVDDTYDYHWEINELEGTPIPIVEYELYYSDWQFFSHDMSTYSGPLTIRLASGNGVDDEWNTWTYVDNTAIAETPPPVPEPSTILSFIFLLVGFITLNKFNIIKKG